jgi:hypothetical protein
MVAANCRLGGEATRRAGKGQPCADGKASHDSPNHNNSKIQRADTKLYQSFGEFSYGSWSSVQRMPNSAALESRECDPSDAGKTGYLQTFLTFLYKVRFVVGR